MCLCLDRRAPHRPDKAEEERQDQAALQRRQGDSGSSQVMIAG